MKLHGVWILEDESFPKGKLFLWAEELKPKSPKKQKKSNAHPYALSSKEILANLKVPAVSSQQTLLLPSSTLFPIPSS